MKGRIHASPELLSALKEVNEEAAKLIAAIEQAKSPSERSGMIYRFASKIFTKGYYFEEK